MAHSRLLKLSETTLGGSGVELHYANLIVVMEKMIKQPQLVGLNVRDDLCSMLLATELLSKGVPVDSQIGTPLIWDAGHDLLDHNVDPNAETEDNVTPLLSAVAAGSMACLELLVKVPKLMFLLVVNSVANDGNKPLEVASLRENIKIVETLFMFSLQKQRGKAQKQKQEDKTHSIFPSTLTHKSYLLLKRSLCWLRLGQVKHALSDAKVCRELKPDWPKECFREGAALHLLQRFDKASNAFYERRSCRCSKEVSQQR
ncbi:LOW QUALITY PROTEIN: hypothetical protein HID58_064883 [Brassica napus]|uniref:DUF668 domain-containing protein n=1 Tax=Brassica napus TaxID=3708 RepID=A0ABQ7ZB80_BRANA|nr:LOW QUALITY PROTEIN: hypothetical protein HID58_064883 [Brassica napus]